NKDNNADVRIIGVTSKLDRQNEQPGEPRGRYKSNSQHADPVAGQKYEYGTFWIIAHVFLTLPARFSISPAEVRRNQEDWTHIADASKIRNRMGLVIVSRRFIVPVPLGRGGAL